MKFLNFSYFWVIFALLDPDPDFKHGYGSTDLIESGSETLGMTSRKITNVVRFSCSVSSIIDFFVMQAMLWDLNDGKHLYTLDHADTINGLCFSPNRCVFACSCPSFLFLSCFL
jgi:hypothetical protein